MALNQSGRFARNFALIAAEALADACGLPIGFPLLTAASSVAGFLSPSTLCSASVTNSDLETRRRRAARYCVAAATIFLVTASSFFCITAISGFIMKFFHYNPVR